MKEFYKNNSRSILIILSLIAVWAIFYFMQSDKTDAYIKSPKIGDVYIFTNDTVFAPMRLDRVEEGQLYMRNYNAVFVNDIPEEKQILTEEFDTLFYAIYDEGELDRLRSLDQIIKIYR